MKGWFAIVVSTFYVSACSPAAEPPADSSAAEQQPLQQALQEQLTPPHTDEAKAFLAAAAELQAGMASDSGSQAQHAAALGSLNLTLRNYVGVPHATALSQCRMLPVGARPCGGPDYYLPFSIATVDELTVQQMVASYTALQQQFNQQYQVLGTCEVLIEPKLTMVANQCVGLPYSVE